ncbi:MAG: thioredoxin [Candidatus Omnitrophota bacterium]
MAGVFQINDHNFQTEVLGSDKPVLVDFFAEWCAPCKRMAPVIEELAVSLGDDVKVGKVNVEESPELAAKFGIMSVPTIMIFKQGSVVKQSSGFQPKEQLAKEVREFV